MPIIHRYYGDELMKKRPELKKNPVNMDLHERKVLETLSLGFGWMASKYESLYGLIKPGLRSKYKKLKRKVFLTERIRKDIAELSTLAEK